MTRRAVKASQNGGFGAKSPPLGEIFRNLQGFSYFHYCFCLVPCGRLSWFCQLLGACKCIVFFARISCLSVSLQRNASSLFPITKNNHFLPPFCDPFAQGAKILTLKMWVWPTYLHKILSGSVQVCWSYSQKADFKQISTYYAVMHIHALQRTNITKLPRQHCAGMTDSGKYFYYRRWNMGIWLSFSVYIDLSVNSVNHLHSVNQRRYK